MRNRIARRLMDFGYWIADRGFNLMDAPEKRNTIGALAKRGIPAADRGDLLDDESWGDVHGDSPL